MDEFQLACCSLLLTSTSLASFILRGSFVLLDLRKIRSLNNLCAQSVVWLVCCLVLFSIACHLFYLWVYLPFWKKGPKILNGNHTSKGLPLAFSCIAGLLKYWNAYLACFEWDNKKKKNKTILRLKLFIAHFKGMFDTLSLVWNSLLHL